MSPSARTDTQSSQRAQSRAKLWAWASGAERGGAGPPRRAPLPAAPSRPRRLRPPPLAGTCRRAGAALRASRSGWEGGQVPRAASSPSRFSRQPGREGRCQELRARAATPAPSRAGCFGSASRRVSLGAGPAGWGQTFTGRGEEMGERERPRGKGLGAA